LLYPAEAKSADAVLPNAAAGASAPMLQFESPASAGLSNLYPAEAKSADAVLPNAAAGASAPNRSLRILLFFDALLSVDFFHKIMEFPSWIIRSYADILTL
jgi:hypothetical protein